MDNSISITFGEPKHGWLPVDFVHQDFQLDFAASDVLNDPIEELYNTVSKLQDNNSRKVVWWLEPGAYFFEFDKKGQNITLIISETNNLHNEKEEKRVLFTITDDKDKILKPFISALKKFSLLTYEENHWPYKLEKTKTQSL